MEEVEYLKGWNGEKC